MLEAVIFDFDGIIADSEPLHYIAFTKALDTVSFNLTEELYYKDYVGYCDRECYENLAVNFPNQLADLDIDRMIEIKMEFFKQIVSEKNAIFDGVSDLLEKLKQNNIPAAICSGAILRDIKLMLDGSNLEDYFTVIVSDDDVSKGKPDPQGYNLTLVKLNQLLQKQIQPKNCVVIEDSHWGIEASQAAGMKTLAVTNTYSREQLAIADKVVDSLTEITIEQLKGITA